MSNEDFVICPYCNKQFKKITILHLSKHNKKIEDFKNDFPNAKLEAASVIEKRRQTCFNRFGKYCSFESEEVKEKIKKSVLKKFGVDNPSKSDEIKNKKKETYLNHFGVDNPNKSSEIKEKKKRTCLSKFNTEYPLLNDEIKAKARKTLIKNFNVDHCSKSEKIKEKKRQSYLNNFGVQNPSKSEKIKDKIIETCLKKYGAKSVVESTFFKQKNKEISYQKFLPILNRNLEILNLELLDEKYIDCYYRHKWKCKKCGTTFEQLWNVIQQGEYNCPVCYPRIKSHKSKSEAEIGEFLKSLGFEIIENDRNILFPKELDIVIHSKKVAIEFNGLYYHSEEIIPDKYYHLDKLEKCIEKDYRLIMIFEDEWNKKKTLVKERLKYILGKSESVRINARDCIIKEISSSLKNSFLDLYHIQSRDSSVVKLGAFYNDELISVMTFSHGNISKGSKLNEEVWELNRFCSNYNYRVPGIASKLLRYFEKNYNWTEIFSYADRRWSDGNLYFKLGFNLSHITTPNYWYIKGNERIHRFNLRKKPNEPKGLTEVVLRSSEGYLRIWDCGNFKFVKKNLRT